MEGIIRFSPGKLPQRYQEELTDFLFPYEKFESLDDRAFELKLYLRYLDQSTVLLLFKNDKIIGTVRCIWKMDEEDRLPIEYAYVTEVKNTSYDFIKDAQYVAQILPSAEVGGLKIADEIPFRERPGILMHMFKICALEGFKRNCALAYVTCDPTIVRLYIDKDQFLEVATITYDFKKTWAALVRNICLERVTVETL